ncbi:N-acetyltransferase [bacterium SCSIO 12643]|nr:N-acetyltransferase [bacterium SCSIO 12643]
MIRTVGKQDAKSIARIYNHYVKYSIVTFDEYEISADEIEKRIEHWDKKYPWFVLEHDGEVVGYAYGSEWKKKSAYRSSVETTVYLVHNVIGKGLGHQLYSALISELKEMGFRMLIGCISLPNPESIRLHEKLGFEKKGQLDQMGFKLDRWIDVGYWQLKVN